MLPLHKMFPRLGMPRSVHWHSYRGVECCCSRVSRRVVYMLGVSFSAIIIQFRVLVCNRQYWCPDCSNIRLTEADRMSMMHFDFPREQRCTTK